MPPPQTLLFVQPALPEYRTGFFASMAEGWSGEVVVAHGAGLPGAPANDTRTAPYRRVEVPWQPTCMGAQLQWPAIRTLAADAALVVVPGDPHVLVSHRLLAIRRFGGRRPLLALSQFRGADARWLPSLLKPWWHRAFDGLILYTRREAEHYLRLGHVARRLTWLDNGLARLPPSPDGDALALRQASGPLVCLGRHVAKNRFDLAISGFAAYRRLSGRRRLLLIGDGPETPALRLLAGDLGDAVVFAGAVYAADALDRLLRSAVAAIHPLAMGLSINTAFGYGLPVVACADPRRHMPEFWIFQDGFNGLGFPAPRGGEAVAVPGIAAALLQLDALSAAEYACLALAAHAVVAPLTTTAMADRVLGLCRRILDRSDRPVPPPGSGSAPSGSQGRKSHALS
jgi:glycosyltransferase involved in cell wall biosynthesis